MPDINTAPYRNIIVDTLPSIDRNAKPLPGMDPSTFLASLTAVLSAGGWPVPHPAVSATGASSVADPIPPKQSAAPAPAATSPLALGASHAYASNAPDDMFSILFGQNGARGQS